MASNVETLKAEGNAEFSKKRFKKAIDKYIQALEVDSSNHAICGNIAAAYFQLKNYDAAVEYARRCVDINAEWPRGYERLGSALRAQQKWTEAIEAFEKCLQLNPESTEAVTRKRECVDRLQEEEDRKVREAERKARAEAEAIAESSATVFSIFVPLAQDGTGFAADGGGSKPDYYSFNDIFLTDASLPKLQSSALRVAEFMSDHPGVYALDKGVFGHVMPKKQAQELKNDTEAARRAYFSNIRSQGVPESEDSLSFRRALTSTIEGEPPQVHGSSGTEAGEGKDGAWTGGFQKGRKGTPDALVLEPSWDKFLASLTQVLDSAAAQGHCFDPQHTYVGTAVPLDMVQRLRDNPKEAFAWFKQQSNSGAASNRSRTASEQVARELGLAKDDGGRPSVTVPLIGAVGSAGGTKEKEFIVKVQVPLLGGPSQPLMLYDQRKAVQTFVEGSSESGRALAALVRNKGVGGMKGYFYACRRGNSVRVYTDELAAPQAW